LPCSERLIRDSLNFYLRYFDDQSPVILIHPPAAETTWNPRNRYIEGVFPQTIRSTEIDTNALFLWEAARVGDNSRRFLYYYRIIEYSAVSYLDYTARSSLRMALAAPNALDDIAKVTEEVVMAVHRMKLDDYQRYEAMLKEVLRPAKLWREIQDNLSAFTTATTFDGGYVQKALLASNIDEGNFSEREIVAFAGALRSIRNHLSHGRDPGTKMMIAPTSLNFVRLQPWVGVVALAASQVLLHKDIF
jgi:hypothetical protein